jgi:hypothetical protein
MIAYRLRLTRDGWSPRHGNARGRAHEIRGQSSIVYVDPTHTGSKPRRHTVFVDEPIALA